MCGIAGAIVRPALGVTRETVGSMLDAMAHRGPDGSGVVAFDAPSTSQQVILGHRRLAIIDPNGAFQPMCDVKAGLALTFNGEIYNFRELRAELEGVGYTFERDSDTEVLLRAYEHWREGVVERLRGMFAFAIWDAANERLFMARDRFGEKPLFMYEDGANFYFASEIKGLLRIANVKREVSLPAVWDYLAYRYVPGPRTLFEGIRKLQPGMAATWSGGRLTLRRYWTAPDRQAWKAPPPHGDTVNAFLERLDQSVKMQMVSDVPFGAFLSGGLDSSAIVALMTRHNQKVKTFSVGFGGSESAYSELTYAGEVARHLGTEHCELVVTEKDMIEHLPSLVAYRDAPVSEASDIPIYMLAKEASRTVKMVLTGEGSDEILGGYPKHVFERFAQAYQLVPGYIRHNLIAPLTHSLPYDFRRAKTAITNLNIEDWRERYVRWFGALNSRERDQLSVLRVASGAASDAPPFDADPGCSTLRRILYFDQTSWLPDNLLERGDRMTMAASIESRVPFLDHELAGFVSSLPDSYRVKGFSTKWILRQAGRSLIPASILDRPKVGFRVPVNQWFRTRMRDYLVEHLQGSESKTKSYYDRQVLDRVVADHVEGRQNHEKLLWALLNLEIWHRHYA